MKVWEQLNYWTNDGLIGPVASELLELARRFGEPEAPQGVSIENPIPFVYPQISDETPEIEQVLRRVGIVLQAIDRHPYWHRGVLAINKPFEAVPDWAKDIPGMSIDPNWLKFESAAREVVDSFLRGLSKYGIEIPASAA